MEIFKNLNDGIIHKIVLILFDGQEIYHNVEATLEKEIFLKKI
uniref:Uncharacterized protein n=1 Tax=Rhizophora mucronata TaxID=61149 RepID=A0A2P2M0V8_RHIMU